MNRKTLMMSLVGSIGLLLILLGAEYIVLQRLADGEAAFPRDTRSASRKSTGMSSGVKPDDGTSRETQTSNVPTASITATRAIQAAGPIGSWVPYTMPASLGNLGPRLLESESIDLDRFVQLCEQRGDPLTPEQIALLTDGSEENLVFNPQNAHFLLNVFWALGLTNANPILTQGRMVTEGNGEVGRYASVGGWTLGAQTAVVLYASEALVSLTPEQQSRLEQVAGIVYRPCCDNPTAFPDCNHGMAMLGLLELLVANDATEAEMLEAALVSNAIWFPSQMREIAVYIEEALERPWAETDPRLAVGSTLASGTGFRGLHQWLDAQGLLETVPAWGTGCGL